MKFSGELKFPEIDHPGVPVRVVIEDSQFELLVEGESLGRWSLYDVRARRLVASAFQIDLDGTEITFVADDPIDFAYRGVEHMAETWATIKSKRIGTRSLAVRKSRKGTIPSRIDEMREAMVANLEGRTASPRHLAGEMTMPDYSVIEEGVAEEAPAEDLASEEARWVEEERQRLAAERAQLEEERRLAEQREADRVEAYRLEMERLQAEREELKHQTEQLAQQAPAADADLESVAAAEEVEPEPEPVAAVEEELEPEPVAAVEEELEPEPVAAVEEELEPEPVDTAPVVDLNDLEAEPEPLPTLDRDAPAPQRQPALAGASRQRGGLMGAVRAAFRSSSREHDHQFVEAPGGMGITRYVCEECGYVSISA